MRKLLVLGVLGLALGLAPAHAADPYCTIADANTGDDGTIGAWCTSSGIWDPIDTRDPQDQVVTANGTSPDHVLTDKSLAIPKGVPLVNDPGVAGPSPGDTLQYTLTSQISS